MRTPGIPAAIGRLVRADAAQNLAEYGIALAIVAGLTAAIAVSLGVDVQSLWSSAESNVADVVNATPPN